MYLIFQFPMASLINRGVHPTTIQPTAISQQVSGSSPLLQAAVSTQAAPQTSQAHVVQTSVQTATPILQQQGMQKEPRLFQLARRSRAI